MGIPETGKSEVTSTAAIDGAISRHWPKRLARAAGAAMTFAVTIDLAGPPVGKGRGRAFLHKNTGRITVATPSKTRTYEAQLRYAAQERMGDRLPTPHPVQVIVDARFPIAPSWPKKKQAEARNGVIWPCVTPDSDNLLKILDALNGVVWIDDKQVVVATVRKLYSDRPGLTIAVDSLEPIEARPTLDDRMLPDARGAE